METKAKPVPVVNTCAKPFWEAACEEKLIIQKCDACGAKIFYPRLFCPECLSDQLGWISSAGKGKVYSYTVVENNSPSAFIGDVPYVVAIVSLDEGVQMCTNIVGCSPYDVKCEMPVQVVFEKLNDEFTLPKFKPVT